MWNVLATVALIAAGWLCWRALRLHRQAEAFRFGCLLQDSPAWGEPVGTRFTPEGKALRRRAFRLGTLSVLSATLSLVLWAL